MDAPVLAVEAEEGERGLPARGDAAPGRVVEVAFVADADVVPLRVVVVGVQEVQRPEEARERVAAVDRVRFILREDREHLRLKDDFWFTV